MVFSARVYFFPGARLPSGSLQNWPLSPPGFVSLPPPGALFHLNLDQLVRQLCGRTNLVEPTKEIRPKLRGLPIRRAIIDPTPPGGEGALIVHIHAAGSPHEELHWNQCPQLDMQKGCICKVMRQGVSGVFSHSEGMASSAAPSIPPLT